jgi:hypothetical protein
MKIISKNETQIIATHEGKAFIFSLKAIKTNLPMVGAFLEIDKEFTEPPNVQYVKNDSTYHKLLMERLR